MSIIDRVIVSEEPEVLQVERKPVVRARTIATSASSDRSARYLDAVLRREVDAVAGAVKGTRNATLNKSAFNCARYADISDDTIREVLGDAALRTGLTRREIDGAIGYSITAGRAEPREIPDPMNDLEPVGDDTWPTDADAPDAPPVVPTSTDPMRGLASLSRVAVVGRERLLQLASEPIQYIWQDLVVAGTIVGIAGPPAEGKTTLLFLLLAARLNMSEPINLLNHELQPARPGTWVVLIEGEHGEASAARKMVGSFDLLGLDNAGLDRLILVARKAVTLGSDEWRDVVRLVQAGLVSDIALDTVARVAPANADNEAEQVAIFDTVARAIEQAPDGCQPTCWAVMHTRKSSTGELADVSGSAQRTGQADSVFLLKADKTDGRVNDVTVTFAKLRETPDEYPSPESFAIANGPDGARELRQGLAATSDTKDERSLEERILDQLSAEPRTKTWLATHLRKGKAEIDDALTNLFDTRRIQTTNVTVGGRSFKAFEPRATTVRAPSEVISR